MADENKTITTETEEQQINTSAKTEQESVEVDYKAEYEKLIAERDKLLNENKRQKDATDKACSEAANFKKQLREKQTEQERVEAERAEREAAKDAELAKYRAESRINGYKSKLLECGYDLDTATAMAEQLPEGVSDDFFAKQKAFNESQEKAIEAKLLNKQPGLSKGAAFSKADTEKMELDKLRGYFGLK